MKKILIVEDDTDIATLLNDYLSQSGFDTAMVDDGHLVMARVREWQPDMILLDVNLPNADGFTLCRDIRASHRVPIMMITARVEEIDRLLGLELGADDYVCKPFSPREVVARVKAILRRGEPVETTPSITVDEDTYSAVVAGKSIELTRTEFQLLAALVRHPHTVFSRDQLSQHAYGDGRIVVDRTIDSHIKNIRRKIEDMGMASPIKAVYGVGYRFEPRSLE